MTKIRGYPPEKLGDLRAKGSVATHLGRYGMHMQAWPRKRGRARQGYDLYRQIEFAICAQLAAHPYPLDYEMAVHLTKGTTEVPRDWLMRNAMGLGITVTMEDGRTLTPARMTTPNPLYWLDLISDVPGSIVFRSTIGWIALGPGAGGQVLAFVDVDNLAWIDLPEGGAGSPDFSPPPSALFPNTINSPTVTDSDLGLGLAGAANAQKVYGLYKTLPAADKVIVARVATNNFQYNFSGAGIIFRNSSSGKILLLGLHTLQDSDRWVQLAEGGKWNSSTSYSVGTGGGLRTQQTAAWIKATYTASSHNIRMDVSLDGINWNFIFNDTAWCGTPDGYGVGVDARNTSGAAAGAITWWDET